MRHFVNIKTGEILGYDSGEQSEAINSLDRKVFKELKTLPNHDEVWDASRKAFKPKTYTIEEQRAQVRSMRAAEYPPQADYLDAVVKGDMVAKQAYIDACLAIKAKYPMP